MKRLINETNLHEVEVEIIEYFVECDELHQMAFFTWPQLVYAYMTAVDVSQSGDIGGDFGTLLELIEAAGEHQTGVMHDPATYRWVEFADAWEGEE